MTKICFRPFYPAALPSYPAPSYYIDRRLQFQFTYMSAHKNAASKDGLCHARDGASRRCDGTQPSLRRRSRSFEMLNLLVNLEVIWNGRCILLIPVQKKGFRKVRLPLCGSEFQSTLYDVSRGPIPELSNDHSVCSNQVGGFKEIASPSYIQSVRQLVRLTALHGFRRRYTAALMSAHTPQEAVMISEALG